MKMSPRMKAKQKVYRAGIYCLIALIPIIMEGYFLWYLGVPEIANSLILIVTLIAFYIVFTLICNKIDKKREEKEKQSKTRDPFTE